MTIKRTITSNNALIELFQFQGKSESIEYHAYIHATNSLLSFQEQLQSLAKAAKDLLSLDPQGTKCFMARCHVSDAANQSDTIKNILSPLLNSTLSIIQQPPLDGTKIALWIYAVSNVEKEYINGISKLYHNGYKHYWTTEKGNSEDSTYQQTVSLLDNSSNMLKKEGISISDNCKRTWLYVNDIDNHYADVVNGRNDVFDREKLTEQTHYIASTGIFGYTGKRGVNVMLDTYSIKGLKVEQTQYLYALSNLNRTSEYGVRFERGVAIKYGDRTHTFISGTASIDNMGNILYPNDIKKQTQRMWKNVEALLAEVDMHLDEDVAMMTVYLRDMADYNIVKVLFEKRFPNRPKAIVLAPVCRPGWLIEMECICIKETKNKFRDF